MMRYIVGILFVLNPVISHLMSIPEAQKMLTNALLSLLPKEDKVLHALLNIFRLPKRANLLPFQYRTLERVTADCIVCHSTFQAIFNGNKNDKKALMDSLTTYCTWLSYGNKNVCRGSVELNFPIIEQIISRTNEATPDTFCGVFLQNENTKLCGLSDPRFDWTVDLPERTVYTRKFQTNSPEADLNVVVLTDTHIDPKYKVNGETECDEPICCREGQQPSTSFWYRTDDDDDDLLAKSFVKNAQGQLFINVTVPRYRKFNMGDIFALNVNKNSRNAGYWGDYRTCDTPVWAFTDILENIAKTHKKIDAIYYIGDTVSHGTWETNDDLVVLVNNYLIKEFRRVFSDKVLIVPAIGNHDSHPANQFSMVLRSNDSGNTTKLYKELAQRWGFYLTDKAKKSFKDIGSFSMKIKPGLRVISLNNNVAYKGNWWLVQDPELPKKQLDFLVQELLQCEMKGESAHILTHVPPGSEDLLQTWTREYRKVVDRFSDTIVSEFNGHNHADEFKLFYNRGRPSNVAWGGGSATTYPEYNVNYKYASFHGGSYIPKDIRTYSYNLTEANLTPEKKPKWRLLYDMRTTYDLNDLSAKSLDQLVETMVTDRHDLLDMYTLLHSKSNVANYRACDVSCKIKIICRSVTTVLYEDEKCKRLKNLFFGTLFRI